MFKEAVGVSSLEPFKGEIGSWHTFWKALTLALRTLFSVLSASGLGDSLL